MKSLLRFFCILVGLSLASLTISCKQTSDPLSSDGGETTGDSPNGRSGAVCKDGTTSTATGKRSLFWSRRGRSVDL